MSVYKSFTTSDVVVTPFKVNKSYSFEGTSSLNSHDVGIDRYLGSNISSPQWVSGSNSTGRENPLNQELVYNSIKQLYYTNFISDSNGSPVLTSSISNGVLESQPGIQPMYENYLPSTLPPNRYFPTGSDDVISVISIPSSLFGENIKPGTIEIEYSCSIVDGILKDDGNGNLYQEDFKVGDVIYQHGMIIITDFPLTSAQYGTDLNPGYVNTQYGTNPNEIKRLFVLTNDIKIDFQSTLTVYESQYKCTFNPNEFTFSQNPSIISGSCGNTQGKLMKFATQPYFEPYITTVGLYNRNNELVAVGKLSQPLQSSTVTDTTVLVNLDL
tara:strand:- start:1833 stop:2813 length:981 start_codon:yes stop_codon:yes gene_type:complete